jgi:hypothetical protein
MCRIKYWRNITMDKLYFDDAVKAIEEAGLNPEVTPETETDYGSIRYKLYNSDRKMYVEFLMLFDQGIFVDQRVEVYNA